MYAYRIQYGLTVKKYNEKIEVEPYTESTALLHSIPKYNELFYLIFWILNLMKKLALKLLSISVIKCWVNCSPVNAHTILQRSK